MTAFGFGEWGLGLRLVGGDKCVASWRSSLDRKSTRLNSSHGYISYAVFCLKKKKSHGSAVTRHADDTVYLLKFISAAVIFQQKPRGRLLQLFCYRVLSEVAIVKLLRAFGRA